jgi:hypothetical protein
MGERSDSLYQVGVDNAIYHPRSGHHAHDGWHVADGADSLALSASFDDQFRVALNLWIGDQGSFS